MNVPIKVVAEVFGKNPAWVRAGIVGGWLPIGIATRQGRRITDISEIDTHYGRINYYVSPQKLYEMTGYLWEGDK